MKILIFYYENFQIYGISDAELVGHRPCCGVQDWSHAYQNSVPEHRASLPLCSEVIPYLRFLVGCIY